MKILISGKITGLDPEVARQNFARAADFLKSKGHFYWNPFDFNIDNCDLPWEVYLLLSIKALLHCDAIYMLSDWRESKGARILKTTAETTGKHILFEYDEIRIEGHLQLIETAILEVTGFRVDDFKSKNRKRELFYPRLMYTYFAESVGVKHEKIAQTVNRDHSMISYYLNKFPIENKYNKEFSEMVSSVQIILEKSVSV